jgi:PEP-CTERM motif
MKAKTIAAVLIMCATLPAPIYVGVANATTYTLVNIKCATEDCSMTGTFDYNGSFSNINITMTGSVFPGRVFNADEGSSATQLFVGDNNASIPDYFVFNFLQPLNGANDTIVSGCGASTQGPASDAAAGCSMPAFLQTFELTGSVQATSATPLPATLSLFASGLGTLGLLGWRRKRKAAALAV